VQVFVDTQGPFEPHVGSMYLVPGDFSGAWINIGGQNGKNNSNRTEEQDSRVDEMYAWNTDLSDAAIEQLFNDGVGRFHSGVVS
jgi:hypothetical protein